MDIRKLWVGVALGLVACSAPGGGIADDALKLGGRAPEEYQRRLSNGCPAEQFAQSVAADGTVSCAAPTSSTGGDITAVSTATGSGLTGGGDTGAVSVALINCPPGSVLKRTSGAAWDCALDSDGLAALSCSWGQVPMFFGGAWICSDLAGGVVSVAAGGNGGVSTSTVGSAVTVSLITCATGQVLKSTGPGTWGCAADAITTGAPEAWHEVGASGEPPFGQGWSNYMPSLNQYQTAAFRKDQFGRVHIKGVVIRTSGTSEVVFTLPPGYRPSRQIIVPAVSNWAFSAIALLPGGNVHVSVYNGDFASLGEISFETW